MKTIVLTARVGDWTRAIDTGYYDKSTINSSLAEVGFIHCSFPDQVMAMANRKYRGEPDLVLLLINPEKVTSEIRYERALSGRPGIFPHIFGALNVGAVYGVAPLVAGPDGSFLPPDQLASAGHSS